MTCAYPHHCSWFVSNFLRYLFHPQKTTELVCSFQKIFTSLQEKFVVLKLFKLLFRHDPADVREDERAEKALSEAAGETAAPLLQQVGRRRVSFMIVT